MREFFSSSVSAIRVARSIINRDSTMQIDERARGSLSISLSADSLSVSSLFLSFRVVLLFFRTYIHTCAHRAPPYVPVISVVFCFFPPSTVCVCSFVRAPACRLNCYRARVEIGGDTFFFLLLWSRGAHGRGVRSKLKKMLPGGAASANCTGFRKDYV